MIFSCAASAYAAQEWDGGRTKGKQSSAVIKMRNLERMPLSILTQKNSSIKYLSIIIVLRS
jgi:hypothetical protein